jgi:hypothetical protein
VAIGTIFLIIVAIYGLKAIKNFLGLTAKEAAEKENKKEAEEVDKELAQVVKKARPTKATSEFNSKADILYSALNKSFVDKNHNKAVSVLNLIQNDADFLMLKRAFGFRQDYAFGVPMGNKIDMVEFVKNNLNSGWIDYLNKAYAKSKISYRF